MIILERKKGRHCHRRDSPEFESDNDLHYHCHKRARLCLVCGALMQGENWCWHCNSYACWPRVTSMLCQLFKKGIMRVGSEPFCPWGIEINSEDSVHWWTIQKMVGSGVAQRRVQLVTDFQWWITFLWCCSVGYFFFLFFSFSFSFHPTHNFKIPQSLEHHESVGDD